LSHAVNAKYNLPTLQNDASLRGRIFSAYEIPPINAKLRIPKDLAHEDLKRGANVGGDCVVIF
jgi:sortase (surface protein transpeptidase)